MKIKVNNLDIESILFSGACFRTIKENNGSITNILKDRIINLKQEGNYIYVESSNNDNLEKVIRTYFDLDRDYNSINSEIIKRNNDLKDMVNKCLDYKILRQDPFEMYISYILSACNNVKRIRGIVKRISETYGTKITYNNKDYYLFPTYEQIKDVTLSDLRKLGVGFRDEYIRDFLNKYESLKDIDKLNSEDALNKLESIQGVGLKVASCILLFGYGRLDVFPIDTWVRKYMSNKYNIKGSIESIKEFSKEKYKEYSGLVIQYMFHVERNEKD